MAVAIIVMKSEFEVINAKRKSCFKLMWLLKTTFEEIIPEETLDIEEENHMHTTHEQGESKVQQEPLVHVPIHQSNQQRGT